MVKGQCDPKHNSPFHHGTEIWYPDGMSANATYRVCTGHPYTEDNTCINSVLNLFLSETDHTLYFDQMASKFGKSGCIVDMQSVTNFKYHPVLIISD